MKKIGERLRALRQDESLIDFASRFGVSKSTLSRYEKETCQPDAYFLEQLSKELAVCPRWLLMGGAKPCKPFIASNDDGKSSPANDHITPTCLAHQAGHCSSHCGPNHFYQQWSATLGIEIETLLAVRVNGDAMAPTFTDGSLLLVDQTQSKLSDAVFAIRQDHKIVIRRLQRIFDGCIQVKTDNKFYASQVIDLDKNPPLEIVGRVVWAGATL